LAVLSLPTDALSGGALLHSEEGIFRKCNQCKMTLRAIVVFNHGGYCSKYGNVNMKKKNQPKDTFKIK